MRRRRKVLKMQWVCRQAVFATRRAKLRAIYWYILRGYEYEICMDCGRRVGAHTGSWWHADDVLWERVGCQPSDVMCPPCFTARADARNVWVSWAPGEDRDVSQLPDTGRGSVTSHVRTT